MRKNRKNNNYKNNYNNNNQGYIDFYEKNRDYYELTNFWEPKKQIYIDGKKYKTTEHYFQAMKFQYVYINLAEIVRKLDTPRDAFQFVRMDSIKPFIRKDWQNVKENYMKHSLINKFTQDNHCKTKLLSTGDKQLYEHTKNDSYWGDGGQHGKGKNRLGSLLMEVRTEISDNKIYQTLINDLLVSNEHIQNQINALENFYQYERNNLQKRLQFNQTEIDNITQNFENNYSNHGKNNNNNHGNNNNNNNNNNNRKIRYPKTNNNIRSSQQSNGANSVPPPENNQNQNQNQNQIQQITLHNSNISRGNNMMIQPITFTSKNYITFEFHGDKTSVKSVHVKIIDYNNFECQLIENNNGFFFIDTGLKLSPGEYSFFFIINGNKRVISQLYPISNDGKTNLVIVNTI
eukprot:TRINITY_DN2678_c0_g2_i2.p1 TRINITY_DN2678_c0_g2~~TRINITY_DN2678_c0_g2_i2.p1  ORF type:complete len:403 (-),score=93.06 TRINITY_DN2678_c0_g2_i2:4-1212(-)